ncbi:hypothetical protein FAP39_17140 [Shimia litoralis]|uniref:Flagellar biosynthesis protein FlgN n=1 Tax=Shimia litoralis TaxID=420403 RepID=A0A4V6F0J0_9RHOB|nr:hypothetical protein [Shimia litoralis]TKZ15461.1 hypothetical protein FAP39_17140 [Shimia litoralis]
MKNDTAGTAIESLNALLEDERQALLKGDLNALPFLLERKEAILDTLNSETPSDPDRIKILGKKLRHNQVLLEGAMRGIRMVSERLEALKQLKQSLHTYDQQGQKSEVLVSVIHQVEKRA